MSVGAWGGGAGSGKPESQKVQKMTKSKSGVAVGENSETRKFRMSKKLTNFKSGGGGGGKI